MRWRPWRRKPNPVTAVVEHYGQVVALLNEYGETFSTAVGDVYEVTDVRLSDAALAAQEQRNRNAGGDT